VVDPTGSWLLVAHQGSDTITVLRVDPVTGLPSLAGKPIALSRPVCLLFAAAVTSG
jgi:6-phosphogluconolactonase